jgi:hypothetical protein
VNQKFPIDFLPAAQTFDYLISRIAKIRDWLGSSGFFLRPACHGRGEFRFGFEGIRRSGRSRNASKDDVVVAGSSVYSLLRHESASLLGTSPAMTEDESGERDPHQLTDDSWNAEALSTLINQNQEALSDTLARHYGENGVRQEHVEFYYIPQYEQWSRSMLSNDDGVVKELLLSALPPHSVEQTYSDSGSEND